MSTMAVIDDKNNLFKMRTIHDAIRYQLMTLILLTSICVTSNSFYLKISSALFHRSHNLKTFQNHRLNNKSCHFSTLEIEIAHTPLSGGELWA
jgi:hypothetical protein